MDKALYVAMTGAKRIMEAQTVNSHNLANASTTGFRAELVASLSRPVEGAGLPTRVNALAGGTGWDATSGGLQTTGRALDVAMREDVWLVVQAADGSEAYTKAGELQLDSSGMLRLSSGQPVLGDGGPLAIPPSTQIDIGADGTVSVIPQGSSAQTLVALDRLRTVQAGPADLVRGTDGLMRAAPGSVPPPAAGAVLRSGVLESSNVNLPEAMVNMIDLARQFELQIKLMRTAEDNARASSSLVQMNG